VWDEVSMMWMQEVLLAIERFPNHKHVFCGDPGFQLPPVRQLRDDARSLVPFSVATFPGHVQYFNENRRGKCPKLLRILTMMRRMIQDGEKSAEQISEWTMREFEARGRVIPMQEAIHMYEIDRDTVLVSCHSYADE